MNWSKPICSVVAVLLVVLLCSCASIVSKSDYPVKITSDPSGADVIVVDEAGEVFLEGKTPATVILSAGAGYFKAKDYTVTYSKPGYATYTAEIKHGVDGWYIGGNLIFGGLIGWLIVDPATGNMWTLPKEVSGKLSADTSGIEGSESLRIVSLDDLPRDARSDLVPLN